LPALTFAHRALAASEIFFLAAALIVRFFVQLLFGWLIHYFAAVVATLSAKSRSIFDVCCLRSCFDVSSIMGVYWF